MMPAAWDRSAGWLLLALVVAGLAGLVAHRRHAHRVRDVHDAGTDLPAIPRALRRDVVTCALVASVVGFGLLAVAIVRDSRLVRWDAALLDAVGGFVGTAALHGLAALTWFGDPLTLTGLGLLVAGLLAWRRQWLLLGAWAVGTLGVGLLVRWTKDLFARARPPFLHDVVQVDTYSFPSGHSAGALVVYGMLAWLLVLVIPPRWQRPAVSALVLFALAVSTSRVLLQVHYVTDVLAGWLLGLAWLVAVIGAAESARRIKPKSALAPIHTR